MRERCAPSAGMKYEIIVYVKRFIFAEKIFSALKEGSQN
jgi:hypothetical protein